MITKSSCEVENFCMLMFVGLQVYLQTYPCSLLGGKLAKKVENQCLIKLLITFE